jgi:PEP-CTERM motif
MKKLLTLSAFLAAASLSFGQGLVNFAASTSRISTNSVTGGPTTGVMNAGTGPYYFALYVAPSTQNTVDNSLTGWTFVGLGTNTTAGKMNGDTTADPGLPVPGYGISATADFVVIAWGGNLGASTANALAFWNNGGAASGNAGPLPSNFSGDHTFFSISPVANDLILGGGGQPIPNIFFASPSIPSLTLNYLPVPEPASFALMGMGAAALMIFRRRK